MPTFPWLTVVATCPEGKIKKAKYDAQKCQTKRQRATQHNKNPMWRDVKLASELQPLRRWLQGHPSADCLLGNEAVMFLTVMERLSSRWQQDMTAGMTHIQRHREAANAEPASGPDTRPPGRKISRIRAGLLGDVDRVSSGAESGGRTINGSD